MKRFVPAAVIAAIVVLTGCAPGSWYAGHPTTKEELLEKNGPPYRSDRTEEGKEKLVYRFEGDGTVYLFWIIEDGMVVRTGME